MQARLLLLLLQCGVALWAGRASAQTLTTCPSNATVIVDKVVNTLSLMVSAVPNVTLLATGPQCVPASNQVLFYSFRPSRTGYYSIDTKSNDPTGLLYNPNTALGLYATAANCAQEIECNDVDPGDPNGFAAGMIVSLTAGMTYIIGVFFSGAPAPFVLNIGWNAVPYPDVVCPSASTNVIDNTLALPVTVSATNSVARLPNFFPHCTASMYGMSYSYTPLASGYLTFDTLNSTFDTVLAVFQAGSSSDCNQIACNDDLTRGADNSVPMSWVNVSVFAGTNYQIYVGGFQDRQGRIVLRVGQVPFPQLNGTKTTLPHGTCYSYYTQFGRPPCECQGGWGGTYCDQPTVERSVSRALGWGLAVTFILLLCVIPCMCWRYRVYRARTANVQHEGLGAREKDGFQLGQI